MRDAPAARQPSDQVAVRTVTDVDEHNDPAIELLRIDGEKTDTTPDHRFLTDHGWVEAQALDPGTKDQKFDGSFGTVEGYAIERRAVIMWDLTVSDVHTFAVGEGASVIHNARPCGAPRPALDLTRMRRGRT